MNKIKEIWLALNEETKTVVKTTIAVISLILTFVVGINLGCINMIDKSEYNKVVQHEDKLSEGYEKLSKNYTKLEDEKKEVESKYKELQKATEGYTSLNENEKQVIDAKIEEVKKQTQEQIEAEKKAGISDDSALGKIKIEYEKDFGTNTVLMLQIELTHAISDLWYKENTK